MKKDNFIRRKNKVRTKIRATGSRPRLSVFRSNKFIYAQIIDDEKGVTVAAAKGPKVNAKAVGEEISKRGVSKKVKKVVFDKGGYKYHGSVKALADAARKGGLDF